MLYLLDPLIGATGLILKMEIDWRDFHIATGSGVVPMFGERAEVEWTDTEHSGDRIWLVDRRRSPRHRRGYGCDRTIHRGRGRQSSQHYHEQTLGEVQ